MIMAKKGNDGRRPAKGHRADADSPWKLILRQYFQQAIEFFFPDIAMILNGDPIDMDSQHLGVLYSSISLRLSY